MALMKPVQLNDSSVRDATETPILYNSSVKIKDARQSTPAKNFKHRPQGSPFVLQNLLPHLLNKKQSQPEQETTKVSAEQVVQGQTEK
uniref:Uncharacterized protein n=1 Tax=Arundo donax TaxID=35708 RepID=A0A0A9CUG4_ARUDO